MSVKEFSDLKYSDRVKLHKSDIAQYTHLINLERQLNRIGRFIFSPPVYHDVDLTGNKNFHGNSESEKHCITANFNQMRF